MSLDKAPLFVNGGVRPTFDPTSDCSRYRQSFAPKMAVGMIKRVSKRLSTIPIAIGRIFAAPLSREMRVTAERTCPTLIENYPDDIFMMTRGGVSARSVLSKYAGHFWRRGGATSHQTDRGMLTSPCSWRGGRCGRPSDR